MKYKKVRQRETSAFLIGNFSLADLISTIEFNEDGEFLAVGDKGGRIVIFQREQQVMNKESQSFHPSLSPRFSVGETIRIQCLYNIPFS